VSIYSFSYEYKVSSLEGRMFFGVDWETEINVFFKSKGKALMFSSLFLIDIYVKLRCDNIEY